jgi:hypothetical protein
VSEYYPDRYEVLIAVSYTENSAEVSEVCLHLTWRFASTLLFLSRISFLANVFRSLMFKSFTAFSFVRKVRRHLRPMVEVTLGSRGVDGPIAHHCPNVVHCRLAIS